VRRGEGRGEIEGEAMGWQRRGGKGKGGRGEKRVLPPINADSTGATGNFAPVLTQEPGQTLRFAPVPFMAVL